MKNFCVTKIQLYPEAFEQNPRKVFIGLIKIRKQQCKVTLLSDYISTLSYIEGFDFERALKLRPYASIFSIYKSSLEKYLKISKDLRMQAILYNHSGSIYESYNQGPAYSYMLPWKSSNCFSGHLSVVLFCMYSKNLIQKLFPYWHAGRRNGCLGRWKVLSRKKNYR